MDKRNLLILIAAAVALIAIWSTMPKSPEIADRTLLVPSLKGQLNDIDSVTVTAGGGRLIATLQRGPTQWTIAERSGYPADVGKIRKNLIALAEARILEEKTSDPDLYDRLAVEDIDQEEASGIQLIIQPSGQGSDEPIAMIIGDGGIRGNTTFVRRRGEVQSYLVEADFDLSKDTVDWAKRDLMDISSADIHAVSIEHPDGGTLRIQKAARGDPDFSVLDIPDGRELDFATTANSIGGSLSALKFDDVILAGDVDTTETNPVVSRFETFDGLVIEVNSYQVDGQIQVAFRARADESLANRFGLNDETDATEDEDAGQTADLSVSTATNQAEELNLTLGPWMYSLPSFKADQFVKRLDDLLKPANE